MRWPWCLAEIALYALLAGLGIWMGLDARERWKQLREQQAPAERDDAAPDQDDGREVSAVRPRPAAAPDDTDPPPLAS